MFEGVNQIVDELFNFVRTTNDTMFRKKELDIDQFGIRSQDNNMMGMIKDMALGGGLELADGLTGVMSFIRSKAKHWQARSY